jgi:hypothetical protein
MSRGDTAYERYLSRKRQKQTTRINSGGARVTAPRIALAGNAPIHESLVPAALFEKGIGNLVFSRSLPDGRLALAAFLLDVFCLGVKNAFSAIMPRHDYAKRLIGRLAAENLQPIDPACFRKLVEGGVAYAHELGFSPHADYAVACQIFGDVQPTPCSRCFEYGRDGKPFYISGPHETSNQIETILEQLQRRLGPGNFDYLVLAQ